MTSIPTSIHTPAIVNSGRIELPDKSIRSDVSKGSFDKHWLRRVSAKDRTFEGVTFKYTIFEHCYFRGCRFIDCDFTGASFVDCNLHGSTFDGSRFDYSRFTRTLGARPIIDRHLPGHENLQLELAQILRANFAQIGDTVGVNRAIVQELRATRIHFFKAAYSRESYYRKKYGGFARAAVAVRHASFVFLDIAWGNGESLGRTARTMIVMLLLIAAGLYLDAVPPAEALQRATPTFFGITASHWHTPIWLATFATAARFVMLGLFMSVLVKRLSRR